MEFPGERLVIKLWETLAEKGVGSLLSPWQAKREGMTRIALRRHELLILAQVDLDSEDIRCGRKQLLPDGSVRAIDAPASGQLMLAGEQRRIEPRLDLPAVISLAAATRAADSARSEINVAKAVAFAEEQLADDPQEPPKRAIDEDWLHAWRADAGRVSSEDLQRLWGSVLAGEVKSPGSHSLRTLEFLRSISKPEAELIANVARFAVGPTIVRSQAAYLAEKGLTLDVFLRLQELGIVSGVESIGLNHLYPTVQAGKYIRPLTSHSKALIVEHDDEKKVLKLEIYKLTQVGVQILSLGSFVPDLEYLRAVGKGIVTQGFTVNLCDWRVVSEGVGNYSNAERIDA